MITLLSLTLSNSARERTLRIMSLWPRGRRAIKKERRGEGMEYRSHGGEVKGKWANPLHMNGHPFISISQMGKLPVKGF